MYLPNKRRILVFLILWRLTSVFIIQTAHVPDEYWQSLEVAHRLAFGYGFLTWEWIANIRSYIYPFFISVVYRLLAVVSLDSVSALTTLPRIIQGLLSAYGEYRFYSWTRNKWALYSLCINWYWYYCATRTLINTVETACTMIALSMFPWRDSNIKSAKFLWLVGFLCMMRPTAAIIWIPLCLYHFCTSSENKIILISQYGMIGGLCFLSSTLLDSYHYQGLVISPWEFFRVNILYKVGDLYGTEHLLWYLASGLPVLLGLHYIIFLMSVWQIIKHPVYFHRQSFMLIVIVWTIIVYSLLSHKEFRFLLPLLPMILYISTSCTLHLNIRFTESGRKIFLALLTLSNILPGLYFCLIHQRGSLDVMKVLHSEVSLTNDTSMNILFLTPCHATPLYSHLHKNVSTKILTCEPDFQNTLNYTDEADTFFANPMRWLQETYDSNKNVSMPSHVIAFENILPVVTKFFANYTEIAEVFYAHFPQSNYGRYIHVYKHLQRRL